MRRRSSNRSARDPTQPFGDTPTGRYAIVELVNHTPGETRVHTYGAHPSILLDPLSGQALRAKQNGRTGLMVHGGAPPATGGLRPTNGCVRLSEDDQGSLVPLIQAVALKSISVSITEPA
ncbi:MAG: L,D-transpeptidase [Bryobacteraceae bacterium]